MRVAVIGSGGREHALAWRLAADTEVDKVYAIPGSAAMEGVAELIPIDWQNRSELIIFLKQAKVDLVVIGPEAPLVEGLTDDIEEEGILVFGPSKEAAQLEGSKVFAKEIMKKYSIPTASYEVFSNAEEARLYVEKVGAPIVIKADGWAAGKGVVVAQTKEEAFSAIDSMLEGNLFGDAGHTVVVEECMIGEEASLLAFSDGETVVPMVSAQDHKRIFDGDKGPNTGGMGTYAPAPVLTQELREKAYETILKPMIEAMKKEGIPYKGCLYAGLMITDAGPKVVEFNARFGDPETQVILPLLKGSLAQVMKACAEGRLMPSMVEWEEGNAACVIMASAGYPESSRKGDIISGDLGVREDSWIFHSGTAKKDGHYVTNGGRVLGVTAIGRDLREALKTCYTRVEGISFDGCQYRKDIGQKAFK